MFRRIRFLLLLLAVVVPSAALAEEGGKKPDAAPMSPVSTPDAVVLQPMRFALVGRYAYFDQDRVYTGDGTTDPGYGKRQRTVNAYSLTLRAGLFEDFEASLTLPYWSKEMDRTNAKGKEDASSVEGLGDAQIMARYQLLSQKKGDPLFLALGVGLDAPTGDSDKTNSFGGAPPAPYMGPFLQLGTGSWNPKANLAASYFFGRSRLDAHVQYTLYTEGSHEMERGDQFLYNLSYGYMLNEMLTADLELNGSHQEKNFQQLSPGNVGADPNSGCDQVFLTPGVSVRLPFVKGTASLGVALPIYTKMNGTQPAEEYRILAKLGVRF